MSGVYITPLKRVFLNLSGGTVTGETVFNAGLYANLLTGGTYYSGSTLLETIINNIAANVVSSSASTLVTYVQPGSNITTGGTALFPIVSVVPSPSFNNLYFSGTGIGNALSATTVSASTFYSGSTDVGSLFGSAAAVATLQSQILTKTNRSGDTFTGQVNTPAFSASTVSGGTYYSGSTPLETIIANIASNNENITYVQPGLNTYTGGTPSLPTVNISAATLSYLSATTISGGTYYSGNTPLETVIANIALNNEDKTRVQPGLNTYTGGTANNPTVNISAATLSYLSATTVSASTFYSGSTDVGSLFGSAAAVATLQSQILTKTNRSGDTFTGQVNAPAFSASTISGGTYYSGSTPLDLIVYSIVTGNSTSTLVQPGLNTYTGGTVNKPTVNISAATLTYLSATTISGGTIYSGNTDLQSLFNVLGAQMSTKANLSGATFTGAISATAITDTHLVAGRAVYAGPGGLLSTNSGFTFDDSIGLLYSNNIQVGSPSLSGNVTIWGNVYVMGQAVSAFTSSLLIEDNNIELNYNPTASTASTSLGAGFTIQDGSGVAGTDVFFDIRGTATTVDNRSFATNLADIRIRESGTTSSPNGVRVLAENDILNGGQF